MKSGIQHFGGMFELCASRAARSCDSVDTHVPMASQMRFDGFRVVALVDAVKTINSLTQTNLHTDPGQEVLS
jgi:hypothetical protein